MLSPRLTVAAALLTLLAGICTCLAAERTPLDEMGRTEKLRILVDKVMQPEEGWTTKEWMIAETAENGFNVFSPRKGFDDIEAVVQVTEWCDKYGIYHMPWMRGTLVAPKGEASDGKRMVWGNGSEQNLWSPNSDEFWEWTHRYIVEYAKISASMPALMGVFLDYENYSPGGAGNCYGLSYDDLILGKFAADQGIELPELALNERKKWLTDQGMHEAFAEFQINHWRERCRDLRQAVDEHNPKFMFCIYPAPGTQFMLEACYPEWATDAAPLILADPWTYGRPSKFLPQKEALEVNRKTMERGIAVAEEKGINYIYSGGIDPVVRGADPEFCGKNAVMISDITDGYWIFYEGPKYNTTHPDYFRWFKWANERIAQGKLEAWHEPRVEPEDFSLAVFDKDTNPTGITAPEITGEIVEYPKVTFRGDNLFLVPAKAGQPIEITVQSHQVGHYESLLVWDLRSPAMEKLANGKFDHLATGVIEFTPPEDAVYLLGLSAGSGSYSINNSNVPIGAYAGEGLSFIYGAERLYFYVPEGTDKFSVRVSGQGVEVVKLNVYGPDGELVASDQTTAAKSAVTLEVPVGEGDGQVWSLQNTRAEGPFEDNTIRLDDQVVPVLSFTPEQVFRRQ